MDLTLLNEKQTLTNSPAMKKLLIFIALFSLSTFAQEENPWERPQTENPWETESSEEKKEVVKTKETFETPSPNKADTTVVLTSAQEKEILREVKSKAIKNYKAGGSFAFGFVSGLILNGGGIYLDVIYVLPSGKKEKKAIAQTASDPEFANVDSDKLRSKARSGVKLKKLGYSVLGTLAGSATQFIVLVGIINA